MSSTEIVEVRLPDGAILLARAERIGTAPAKAQAGGPGDVGLRDFLSFTHVASSVRGITRELHKALQAAQPDKVTVELGFDLAVKGSQVLALIADAGTHASVTVRLEWGPGSRIAAEPSADGEPDEQDDADSTGDPESGDSSAGTA
jgi:Trypsin-co-occurring domain 1